MVMVLPDITDTSHCCGRKIISRFFSLQSKICHILDCHSVKERPCNPTSSKPTCIQQNFSHLVASKSAAGGSNSVPTSPGHLLLPKTNTSISCFGPAKLLPPNHGVETTHFPKIRFTNSKISYRKSQSQHCLSSTVLEYLKADVTSDSDTNEGPTFLPQRLPPPPKSPPPNTEESQHSPPKQKYPPRPPQPCPTKSYTTYS